MSTSPLDAIAALVPHRPFQADVVADLLGTTLEEAPGSNQFFTVYRSTAPTAAFRSVEVREPTEASAGRGGLVLLELAEGCVTRADVGTRFGPKSPGPPRPSAHRPPDAPVFDPHPQPWGEIRLGYGPADGCLKQVVLDATT